MRIFIIGAGDTTRDTFIQRRIRGLLDAGVDVVVGLLRQPSVENFQIDPGIIQTSFLQRSWLQTGLDVLVRTVQQGIISPQEIIRLVSHIRTHEKRGSYALLRLSVGLRMLRFSPDIIHFEWNSAAIDHEWLMDYFNIPVVISSRGRQVNIWPLFPGNETYVDALRRSFQKADAVHCVCKNIAHTAAKYGLPPEKSRVIYTAVDTASFTPVDRAPVEHEPVRLLMVGALIWRKGYQDALVALRNLVDHGHLVHLNIIGDGPENEHLVFSIADMGLGDYVSLLGRRSSDYVRNAMQHSDIFLLTSLSEGIANVVVEAMSCGVPVVTTDCGGMREAVSDGVEGFVVRRRDPQSVANALEVLIKDPDLRRRMGVAGRARALNQFDLEQQAVQFRSLYESLLTTPGPDSRTTTEGLHDE